MAKDLDDFLANDLIQDNTPKKETPQIDNIEQAVISGQQHEGAVYNAHVKEGVSKQATRAAEVEQMAKKLNVPSSYVDRNLDELKQNSKRKKLEDLKVEGSVIPSWVDNANKAAILETDLDNARMIEAITKKPVIEKKEESFIGQMGEAGSSSVRQLSSSLDFMKLIHGLGDEEETLKNFTNSILESREAQERLPQHVKDLRRDSAKDMKEASTAWKNFTKVFTEESDRNLLENIAEGHFKAYKVLAETWDVAEVLAVNPKAVAFSAMESSIQSFTPTVVGLGAGVASGTAGALIGSPAGGIPGAAVGGLVGSVGGYLGGAYTTGVLMEYIGTLKEVAEEKGIDLANADQVKQLLKDKDFVEDAKAQALRKGLTVSAIERVSEIIGAKLLGKVFKGTSVASKVGSAGKALVTESVGEGLGEFGGKIAQKLDVEAGDPGEAVKEAAAAMLMMGVGGSISMSMASGVKVTDLLSKKVPTAIKQVKQIRQSSQQAELFQNTLQTLGEITATSEMKNLNSEMYKGLINHTSESSPVYFQAEDWINHWKSRGISPEAKADQLLPGGRSALEEGNQTGGSVQVPLGDFITNFSEEETFQELTKIARETPSSLNSDQAKSISANIPQMMRELSARAHEETKKFTKEVDDLKEFEKQVIDQEMEAGSSFKDAKKKAALISRTFSNQARISGKDIGEFSEQVGLNIKGFKDLSQAQKYIQAQQLLSGQEITEEQYFQTSSGIIKKSDEKVLPSFNKLKDVPISTISTVSNALSFKNNPATLKTKLESSFRGRTVTTKSGDKIKLSRKAINSLVDKAISKFPSTETTVKSTSKKRKAASKNFQNTVDALVNLPSILNNAVEVFESKKGNRHLYSVVATPEGNLGVKIVENKGEILNLEVMSGQVDPTATQATKQGPKTSTSEVPSDKISISDFIKIINGKRQINELFQKDNAKVLDTVNKDSLGFYSKLVEVLQGPKFNFKSMPAKQLLAQLEKTEGLKASELEFTGLKELLENTEGKVFKEDILKLAKEGGLQLTEIVKGDLDTAFEEGATTYELFDEEGNHYGSFGDEFAAQQEAQKWNEDEATPSLVSVQIGEYDGQTLEDLEVAEGGGTKYSKWTMKGGTNYREVLLQLPTTDRETLESMKLREDLEKIETTLKDLYSEKKAKGNEVDVEYKASMEGKTYTEKLAAPPTKESEKLRDEFFEIKKKIVELEKKRNDLADSIPDAPTQKQYRSPHWDEENIMMHFRLQDMETEAGKTLLIEEIQDDWAQAGRKKGYRRDKRSAQKELDNFKNELSEQGKTTYARGELVKELTPEQLEKLELLENNLNDAPRDSVPDRPLKDTKSWITLAFKRILAMAVEQGYDSIALTPGDVQAARYDLSNEVSTIQYEKQENSDKYLLLIHGTNHEVIYDSQVAAAQMEDVIGKELAERITTSGKDGGTLEGEGLKVGGEGIQAFYDQMVPNTIKDYARKLDKKAKLIDVKMLGEETTVKTLPITDKIKTKVKAGQTLFQDEDSKIRGLTSLSIPNQILMAYLQDANKSTGLHEMGHVFLETMKITFNNLKGITNLNAEQEKFLADNKVLLEELGVESLDDIETEHHEKFARLFEAYLLEGKAPSAELETTFKAFRTWLVSVYRDIQGLINAAGFNINLSKDMKEIFDRMLMTEDEILEAEENTGYAAEEIMSIFESLNIRDTGTAIDLTNLQVAYDEAHDEAVNQLTKKQVEQYKKKRTKEYAARKKEIKAKFTEEANTQPVYIASDVIRTGKVNGEEVPGFDNLKISTESLQSYLSEEDFRKFPKSLFKKEGLSAEIVADAVGYESARQLIDDISSKPSKTQYIDTMTELVLGKEFEDFMSPSEEEALNVAALDAVNNDKKAQVQRLELDLMFKHSPAEVKKLIRKTTSKLPSTSQVKAQAKKRMDETKIQDAKPYIYQRLEVRNRREAGLRLTQGKFKEAIDAKVKESLNFQLGREASEVEKFVDKSIKKNNKRFNKSDKDLSKKGNLDMLKTAEAILNQYGMLSDSKADRLETYLDNLKKYDPQSFEKVEVFKNELLDIEPKSYKELTSKEFKNVIEVVDTIYTLGEEESQITLDDGSKVKVEEAVDQLKSDLNNLDSVAIKKDTTKYDKFKGWASSLFAIMTRLEHLFRSMGGNFTKYYWDIANAAQVVYEDNVEKRKTTLNEIIQDHFKGIFQDKTEIDLTQYFKGLDPQLTRLTKQELVMALIHTGNDSNKQKLLLGRGWGELDFNGELVTVNYDKMIKDLIDQGIIDKNLMDGVQRIWDLFEDIKPEVQKTYKKVYGRYFLEIEANSFKTPWGTYRGGYAPAVTDPLLVQAEAARQNEATTDMDHNTFTFAQTSKGFTEARVAAYNKALLLDFRIIPSHIEKAVRFAHIEPAVNDINKIMKNRGLSDVMFSKNQSWENESIKPWLARLATQLTSPPADSKAGRGFNRFINTLRGNANMQLMMANVVNTIENMSDVTSVFLEVDPKYVKQGFQTFVTGRKDTTLNMKDLSPYMRQRLENQIFEINDTYNELVNVEEGAKGKIKSIQDYAKKHTYALQQALQNNMEVIIWQAAYDQAIDKKAMSTKQAAKDADSIVRRTLSSGRAIDYSKVETGAALQKLVLTFYGFFNNKANLFYYSKRETKAKAYLLTIAAPAIVGDLMRRATKGNWDDDKDGEYLDDVGEILFLSQLRFASAFFPGGGSLLRLAEGVTNDKPYDDRLSISPLIGMVEGSKGVYRMLTADEIRGRDIRDSMNFLGTLTGLPLGVAAKPIGFMIDMGQGKQSAENPVDYARGLTIGRSGKK